MFQLNVLGRVGKDPEVRERNGEYLILFTIAHTATYINKTGEKVETTTWINCNLWRKSAKQAEFIKKGDLLLVSGTPGVSPYLSMENAPRANMTLNIKDLNFLPKSSPATTYVKP